MVRNLEIYLTQLKKKQTCRRVTFHVHVRDFDGGVPYLGSRFFLEEGHFESQYLSCGMSTTIFRFNVHLLLML